MNILKILVIEFKYTCPFKKWNYFSVVSNFDNNNLSHFQFSNKIKEFFTSSLFCPSECYFFN